MWVKHIWVFKIVLFLPLFYKSEVCEVRSVRKLFESQICAVVQVLHSYNLFFMFIHPSS